MGKSDVTVIVLNKEKKSTSRFELYYVDTAILASIDPSGSKRIQAVHVLEFRNLYAIEK